LILNGIILFKLKIEKMKKLLLIGLVLGMLTISGFIGKELVTVQAAKQIAAKIETSTMPGPDCKVAYERKCNFGNPLFIPGGTIMNMIDVENYCRLSTISCSQTECVARISVLYGIQPGSPKLDSCLPAGYRGK
jgi:hypothetical protein